MIRIATLSLAMMVVACAAEETPVFVATAAAPQMQAETTAAKAVPTRILDKTAAAQLLSNSGLTLQWIDWDTRGTVQAGNRDGEIWLSGVQHAMNGAPGMVRIDGRVTEIGSDYFIFSGTVAIEGTPDAGRVCKSTRDDWRFAITQGRKYWRLRQFEWCDGLTDYVDIYL